MAQPWSNFQADPPRDEWSRPQPDFWYGVKKVVLFPFRLLGLICVIALLFGGISMWGLPVLADQAQVDVFLLVLRAIDDETPVRPFRRLKYEPAIRDYLLDLAPGETPVAEGQPAPPDRSKLGDTVTAVKTNRDRGYYVHTVRYASGQSQTLRSTTPHTNAPRDQLRAARRGVARAFPPADREAWETVLEWGESLFIAAWITKFDPGTAPLTEFAKPYTGTEDERIWCVWHALRSGGTPEEDLARLPELFEQAFPSASDREAALAWAGELYRRLEAQFHGRREVYAASRSSASGREGRFAAYHQLRCVLPPRTRWTELWLLQQYVGLSPAARTAARERWLGFFPPGNHERVLALGETLAEERRGNGEPLPNAPEVLPALCVFERLTGTDRDGEAATDATGQLPFRKLLSQVLMIAYPNDELYYLLAAGDPLGLHPFFIMGEGKASYWGQIGGFLFIVWVTTLGVQWVLNGFVARKVLRDSTRPLWEKHHAGRGREPWWLAVLGVVLLAGVGTALASVTLSEMVGVQVGSPLELFGGALLATAVGGLLIGICRRVSALFLVACGVDIEQTWADEILGIALGAIVLHHFGNGIFSIGLFALSDLVPALLGAWLYGRRLPRVEHTPPPAPGPAPAPASKPRFTPADINALFR